MEGAFVITFFFLTIIFLNVIGLAHYHWAKYAQPGRKARLATYGLEFLAFLFLALAALFLFFNN